MQLHEMQGLLAGKCLPGDMKVNESLAEWFMRKFAERDALAAENGMLKKAWYDEGFRMFDAGVPATDIYLAQKEAGGVRKFAAFIIEPVDGNITPMNKLTSDLALHFADSLVRGK